MDAVERFTQRQIWTSLANAAAYAGWQGAQLSLFAAAPWATPAALAASLIWFVTLLMLLAPLRHARCRGQWDDERMAHNRLRAMAVSYWCMVIATAALFPVAIFFQLPALDLVRLFAIVVVAAPIVSFFVLEARDGRD